MSPSVNFSEKSLFKDESFPKSTDQPSINVKIKNEFKDEILEEEMNTYLEFEDKSGIQICMKLEPSLEINNNECSEEILFFKDETPDSLPEFSVIHFIEASFIFGEKIKNYFKGKIKDEIGVDEIYLYFEMDQFKDEIIESKYESKYEIDDLKIKYELVDKDSYKYFEIFEELGIEKWMKIETPLEMCDECSEGNSSSDEDERLSEIKNEICEDEMINNNENQIELTDDEETINNYFEIIENIEDNIVEDKMENYSKITGATIPVAIEENNTETINVEVEINFDLGSNQKCFKIYEILDQNNNEEKIVESTTVIPDDSLIKIASQNKKFMCPLCVNYFKDEKTLLKHNLIHIRNKKIHQCLQCYKIFDKLEKLKKHFRYHKQQNICQICKKKFRGCTELKKHLSTIHTSKNDFNCKKCPSKLKTKRILKSHSSERSHKCEICDYAAKRAYDLKRHNIRMHLKPKAKKKSKKRLK